MTGRTASAWQDFGGPFRDLQVVRGPDGAALALARDDAGALSLRRQRADGTWGPWEPFGADATALAAVADARDRVTVFAAGHGGAVRHRHVDAAGTGSAWLDGPGGPAELLAATCRAQTGLVLVAQAGDRLRISAQRSDGAWDRPRELDGGFASLALARNGADHLHLFGLAHDGTLWTTAQRRPAAAWDEWSPLAPAILRVSPFLGPDGRLNLLAASPQHGLGWTAETEPGAGWQPWDARPDVYFDAIATSRAGRGIEWYELDARGAAWREVRYGADFGALDPLGRPGLATLCAVEAAGGHVELLALDEAGQALRLAVP